MALGAERGKVRGLVVRQALAPVAVGLIIGVAAAIAVGRLMSSMLFEVNASDPLTLFAAAAVLGSTAFLASWIPAVRASRLSPVTALRLE
jgi:putative ABC transport system permease protein